MPIRFALKLILYIYIFLIYFFMISSILLVLQRKKATFLVITYSELVLQLRTEYICKDQGQFVLLFLELIPSVMRLYIQCWMLHVVVANYLSISLIILRFIFCCLMHLRNIYLISRFIYLIVSKFQEIVCLFYSFRHLSYYLS